MSLLKCERCRSEGGVSAYFHLFRSDSCPYLVNELPFTQSFIPLRLIKHALYTLMELTSQEIDKSYVSSVL